MRLEEQVDLLKFLDDEKRKSLIDSKGYEILNFKSLEDKGRYTFGPPQQQQRQQTPPSSPSLAQQWQQRNQLSDSWFLVEGIIERDKSYSGLRFELIKKAAGGIYPKEGMDIDSAFRVENHPKDTQSRLVFVSVVFLTKTMAYNFIASVEEYVATQRDLRFQHIFESKEIEAYNEEKLIRLTHYAPRDKYGIPPFDSPVWNVEMMSMDLSALSPTTVYSRSDTVFKRQRIEVEIAFARSDPEGAHTFPKALCKGKYKWLDKQSFNRLALSKDGHSQFDGSGKGRGVTLNTVSKIALEPCNSEDIYIDRIAYKRIHLKLWCRDRKVAEAWRAFLDPNLVLKDFDHGYCYCEWVLIHCETGEIAI